MTITSDKTLPLLPLTTGVVLPGMVVTLALETDEARASADVALQGGAQVLLVPKRNGRYAAVGTIAVIEESGALPNGMGAILVRGEQRATIGAGVPGTGAALWVQAEQVVDPEPTDRARELAREYRAVVENILEIRGAQQIAEALRGIADPGAMADTAGYSPDLDLEKKVELLETTAVERRLEKALGWARDTLAELTLKERIRNDVADGMEKAQRDFILRQQLNAIRKELGEGGDGESLLDGYRDKLHELPETVRAHVEKEIDRLERTSEQNPEHGWIRTWLDTMLELP